MVKRGFYRYEKIDGEKIKVYYPPYSIYKRTIQLFIKRFRKKLPHIKIRYFACGEYGEGKSRPHYHMCLFGYDFPDKRFWKISQSGEHLYRSEFLEKLWSNPRNKKSYGFSSIGEVTFQSAAYVARYTLKKTKDKKEYVFIENYDEETGEIYSMYGVNPEFITMSKGIGLDWWKKYSGDTGKDYITYDYDKKTSVPRYYDKLREREDPESLEKIKQQREEKAKEIQNEDTPKRRYARNKVKVAQNKMLKRGYDNE